MSAPNEPMSQRQLALELRFQIDTAISQPKNAPRALQRVRKLVEDHPRGVASQHVLHNLGEGRLRWLRDHQVSVGDVSTQTPASQ